MTKDEMTALLNSAGVEPRTVDAMVQSYEMGFEHGAKVGDLMRELLLEATAICHELDAGKDSDTSAFWKTYTRLGGL